MISATVRDSLRVPLLRLHGVLIPNDEDQLTYAAAFLSSLRGLLPQLAAQNRVAALELLDGGAGD